MSDLTAFNNAFDKAKVAFISRNGSPFLATILFGVRHIINDKIPTLRTNGLVLEINPDFFVSLDNDLRVSALAHECWHIALDHITRLYDRSPEIWNEATDYVINAMLKNSGKYKIGVDWLYDPQYDNMTSDQVYNLLQNKPRQQKQQSGSGNGQGQSQGFSAPDHMGIPKDDTGQSLPQSVTQAEIQKLVSKAATMSQKAGEKFGNIPGGLEFLLEPILNPKLNWRTILMNYVSSFAKNDYSYRRFNKRYLPDFYMPTLYSEAVGEVAAAFDASGSVSDRDFSIMLGQLKQIHQMVNPTKTTLLTFDTEIQTEHVLTHANNLNKLKFKGRGGTDVHCLFERFAKNPPKVLIIFSDMEFYMPKEKPKFPVIWIGINCRNAKDIKVPFGKFIEYTD